LSVVGSCFGPGAAVNVDFWDSVGGKYPWTVTETVRASATGTLSVQMVTSPYPWATEYIMAVEGNVDSNLISIPPVVAQ
jgi:hypothetical protein